MERDQATKLMQGLLRKMVDKNGSDLFITAGFPPAIKIDGEIHRASEQVLTGDQSALIVRSIMNDRQAREFDGTKECNFAINPQGIGRFRVSAFVQQGQEFLCGVVLVLADVAEDLVERTCRILDRLAGQFVDTVVADPAA